MTEDEMVGWHHQFNGHEFEHTPGDSEGQGSLGAAVYGFAESDTTERLHSLTHSHRAARRSKQSVLKEINPEYSMEGLMLKLKLQSFGHLM